MLCILYIEHVLNASSTFVMSGKNKCLERDLQGSTISLVASSTNSSTKFKDFTVSTFVI